MVDEYTSLKNKYIGLRDSLVSDFEKKFPNQVDREMQIFRERTDEFIGHLDKLHAASNDLSTRNDDVSDKVNNLLAAALEGLGYVRKKITAIDPNYIPDGREDAKEEPVKILFEYTSSADNTSKILAKCSAAFGEKHTLYSPRHLN